MGRRTATAIPPQFHVGVAYVRAKSRGSALRDASGYLRRTRESDVRGRCAITDVRTYAQRLAQHAAAQAEVVGYATFGGGPAEATDVWDRVDELARRKDGEYHRRAGGVPRLAILGELSIPWDLPEDEKVRLAHEMAKNVADTYGVFVEVVCHVKQDHPERGIDHAHLLISMRHVDGDGVVGKMNRDLNGVASRRGVTRVVMKDRTLSGHIVFMRSRWAQLLSEATGVVYDWRTYADQGLVLEPVKDHSRDEIEVDRRIGGPLMAQRAAFVQTRNAAFLRRGRQQADARRTPAARPAGLAAKLTAMDPRFASPSSFSPMALVTVQAATAKRIPHHHGDEVEPDHEAVRQRRGREARIDGHRHPPMGLAAKVAAMDPRFASSSPFSSMALATLQAATARCAPHGSNAAAGPEYEDTRQKRGRETRSEGHQRPPAGLAATLLKLITSFPRPTFFKPTSLLAFAVATGRMRVASDVIATVAKMSSGPDKDPRHDTPHRRPPHPRQSLEGKQEQANPTSSVSATAWAALAGSAATVAEGVRASGRAASSRLPDIFNPGATARAATAGVDRRFVPVPPSQRASSSRRDPADHVLTLTARQMQEAYEAEHAAQMRKIYEDMEARAESTRNAVPAPYVPKFTILEEGSLSRHNPGRAAPAATDARPSPTPRQDAAILFGAALIAAGWRTSSGEERLARAIGMDRSVFAALAEAKAVDMKARGPSAFDARQQAHASSAPDLRWLFETLEEERLEEKRKRRREAEERAREKADTEPVRATPGTGSSDIVSTVTVENSTGKISAVQTSSPSPHISAASAGSPPLHQALRSMPSKPHAEKAPQHTQLSSRPSSGGKSVATAGKPAPRAPSSPPARDRMDSDVVMKLAAMLSWGGALQPYVEEIGSLAGTTKETVLEEANFHLRIFSQLRKPPREIWKALVVDARASGDKHLGALIDRIARDQAVRTPQRPTVGVSSSQKRPEDPSKDDR